LTYIKPVLWKKVALCFLWVYYQFESQECDLFNTNLINSVDHVNALNEESLRATQRRCNNNNFGCLR